ncbi:DUF3556 domain-containing protein [Rhodococcus maanshanensis]|uniref:DUF3556 domain-containing protein n=1 Tax=Rhodococcus maanshanensis TaxID=183556 RepID=UPI0022B43676|nr:DUF3556 domain-containing protein [Rhodococcus maanshanensis]MCZ4557157.1 DUF3556 domain-containing protein [Rhodococcus maanshanensis]
MGFLLPVEPDIDADELRRGRRPTQMRILSENYLSQGFGTPDVVYVGYLAKIALFILGAAMFALTTPGVDGLLDVGQWWALPVVWQKVVLWCILFEVTGLGCGFGPLNLRFLPPLGSFLYWFRRGTIRMPPWPRRVPLTSGDKRGVVDIAAYAALLVSLLVALVSATAAGTVQLPWQKVAVVLGLLAVIGLRDRTIFLAARAEVYGAIAVTFLVPFPDSIVAAKFVLLCIWWGAAVSKLNVHFPSVVQAMEANSPLWRTKRMKHLFTRSYPDDLRPSWLSKLLAHGGTAIEFVVPLVLILSGGGTVTTVAAIVMVLFHLHIIVTIPMGTPLEWNVFMIFAVLTLFVDKASLGLGDLVHPAVLLIPAVSFLLVILGNLFPERICFLLGMRYYAGNWDTTVWCLSPSGEQKLTDGTIRFAMLPHRQLEKIYGGEDEARVTRLTGFAFRAIHTHGRAHAALLPRLLADQPTTEYVELDGETVAGVVLGWNFGDGHLHSEQLVETLQSLCAFDSGELRVLVLDAQPIHKQTQAYRLLDAATGEFERGTVRVADMVNRQPWADDMPVTVSENPRAR